MKLLKSLMRQLRAKWDPIYAMPQTRLTIIIIGTLLSTGTFFYPALKPIFWSSAEQKKELQDYAESQRTYLIELRKQREQAVNGNKRQTVMESQSS
uniref:Uncharacterized protein n=1 Tax=Arion vulgaris TaxID=1028688 RepID=A0A0B7AX20_9EUPU